MGDPLLSSQSFVRALKAPSDPPYPDGPLKIEIARRGWSDTTLYLPNKGELIVEWALAAFLKDRSNDVETSILLDTRYWALLADIVCPGDHTPLSRPVQIWLLPLLNRMSIAATMANILSLLLSHNGQLRHELAPFVRRCFSVIWPLSASKFSLDTVSDCFRSILELVKQGDNDGCLVQLGSMITSSFRTSLSNASNKKKLHASFVQSHLQLWIECVLSQPRLRGLNHGLVDEIYAAGIESLFNTEILGQEHGSKSRYLLFSTLENLAQTSPSTVASILPRIFASFIQCIRRHRSVLGTRSLGQGSGDAEGWRTDGMAFFTLCHDLLGKISPSDETWSARLALQSIVEKERLFNTGQSEAANSLKEVGDLASAALDTQGKSAPSYTAMVIDVLSSLIRIDYGAVSDITPNVLPKLLLVADTSPPSFAFLDLLLDYHVKTHTIPNYISGLLDAVSHIYDSRPPREVYQIVFSGPLLHSHHLEQLEKCSHRFLTSGQVVGVTHDILHKMEDDWNRFQAAGPQAKANEGELSRKRRKLEDASAPTAKSEELAVAFSASSRVGSIVLSSLPVQSTPEAVRNNVKALVGEARKSFHLWLKKTLKTIKSTESNDAWAMQVVAAATLRCWHALDRAPDLPSMPYDSRLSTVLLSVIRDDNVLPELHFEIANALLHSCFEGCEDNPDLILLNLMESSKRSTMETATNWSGLSCQLTKDEIGRNNAGTAMILLLLERWSPLIDKIASQAQLRALVDTLFRTKLGSSSPMVEPGYCIARGLHSAQFWELPNMRVAFLSSLDAETSCLDEADESNYFANEKNVMASPSKALRRAISVYEVLLSVPDEYLSRTCRVDLVRRAVTADIRLSSFPSDSKDSTVETSRSQTVLRVFLLRHLPQIGLTDHIRSPEFLENLLSRHNFRQPSGEYLQATLDLIEAYFSLLAKDSVMLLNLIHLLSRIKLPELFILEEPLSSTVQRLALMLFIDILTTTSSPSLSPEDVRAAVTRLQQSLFMAVAPKLRSLTAGQSSPGIILNQKPALDAWRHALSLSRWLGLSDPQVPQFGQLLVTKIVSSRDGATDSQLDDVCSAALAILLEERWILPETERLQHQEVVAAACISFCRICGTNGQLQIETQLAKAGKSMSISEFSHILDVLLEVILIGDCPVEHLSISVRFLALLMHDAPQHTSKLIQGCAAQCFNLFANHEMFSNGPIHLRLQVLDFILEHCSERPAALRSVDMGSLWSILARFLVGRQEHDDKTTTAIFQRLVAIISALIRLRRDLAILALPHLGMVLRQLILLVRQVRPQLGARQSRLVTDTFPRWVNAADPLTTEEAKAMARVLETLSTKTVSKVHSHPAGNRNAESLAKPFSRHAAFVLNAYIDAMNDSLCIIPLAIRKALQPGLYSLCDMLNEHTRDFLMVSTQGSGGKATLKSLWKEYEKQKYVGKG